MELGRTWKAALALLRLPWLIRIIPGGDVEWEKGTGDPETLAGETFSKVDEDVSVFSVRTDLEEAEVIAAQQLTRNHLQAKVAAVRFSQREAKTAGLRIKETAGGTGVPTADRAHRDLAGGKNNYIALARIVLERQLAGCDRVRRMQKNRLQYQFKRLLSGVKGLAAPLKAKCTDFTR